MRLLRHALERFPTRSDRGGHVLPLCHLVTFRAQLVQHALHERALADPRSQEDGVRKQQNPAPFLEQQGGTKETEPEGNLEPGDERHGRVIPVLHEAADRVTYGGALRLLTGRRGRRRLDGGQEDAARVRGEVEQAVHRERQQGERQLTGEEPDESHSCAWSSQHPRARFDQGAPRSGTYRGIARSRPLAAEAVSLALSRSSDAPDTP